MAQQYIIYWGSILLLYISNSRHICVWDINISYTWKFLRRIWWASKCRTFNFLTTPAKEAFRYSTSRKILHNQLMQNPTYNYWILASIYWSSKRSSILTSIQYLAMSTLSSRLVISQPTCIVNILKDAKMWSMALHPSLSIWKWRYLSFILRQIMRS